MKMLLSLFITMSLIANLPEGDTATKSVPARNIMNVAYGKDSLQTMDIHLPEGRSSETTKSLILIHGGGWNGGSKSDFRSYIDSFRRRMPDYAIFNIDYRLVNNGNIFPSQEIDVKTAIDHIATHADQYQINKNSLVLLGASAGGHLALLHTYKTSDPRVRAVIDFFGPTDLTTMYRKPWHPMVVYTLQMITGTTPDANIDIYKQSSPVNYVSSSSAPTLIFHGEKDQIVDISQSRILRQKLEKAGVHHEMVVYPGERHGWYGNTLSRSFDKIGAFLEANVK
jgi:acetyl esterase/lipase